MGNKKRRRDKTLDFEANLKDRLLKLHQMFLLNPHDDYKITTHLYLSDIPL